MVHGACFWRKGHDALGLTSGPKPLRWGNRKRAGWTRDALVEPIAILGGTTQRRSEDMPAPKMIDNYEAVSVKPSWISDDDERAILTVLTKNDRHVVIQMDRSLLLALRKQINALLT
jgi:hypothetical protein